MQLRALRARQARVARVAKQRVPVDVARPERRVARRPGDEATTREHVERGVVALDLEHRQRRDSQSADRRRRRGERSYARPREGRRAAPRRSPAPSAGSGTSSRRPRQYPPVAVLRENAGTGPHAQELLDEERVAARALGDRIDERLRQCVADERLHQLTRIRSLDRLEVHDLPLRDPSRLVLEQHRPRGRDDRATRGSALVARPVQEREQVARGPVDVLDKPHRRRVADERIEAFEPRCEELLLLDGEADPRLADGGEELRDDGGARRVAEGSRERVATATLVEQLRNRFERREQDPDGAVPSERPHPRRQHSSRARGEGATCRRRAARRSSAGSFCRAAPSAVRARGHDRASGRASARAHAHASARRVAPDLHGAKRRLPCPSARAAAAARARRPRRSRARSPRRRRRGRARRPTGRRAATFTVSPVTGPRSAVASPTIASPVLTPTRSRSVSGSRSSDAFSRSTAETTRARRAPHARRRRRGRAERRTPPSPRRR